MHVKLTMRLLPVVLIVCLMTTTVWGGLLAADGNAMPGWQGTSAYTNGGSPALAGTVDFAVYAPGQFGASVLLGLPGAFDPSGGTQYLYAYEVFNTGGRTANNISIGLLPGGVPAGSTNITDDPVSPAGGIAPSNPPFFQPLVGTPASAFFDFAGTPIGTGQHSDILIFTSPFGPTLFIAALQGGHATGVNGVSVPTPLPEPSTAILSLLAAVGSLAAYRTRRRTA